MFQRTQPANKLSYLILLITIFTWLTNAYKETIYFLSSKLVHCLIFCQIKLICVAFLQKGPHVAKIKNEIFDDLNRAGYDKPVRKKINVLAQIFMKLWSIYELHNFSNYT